MSNIIKNYSKIILKPYYELDNEYFKISNKTFDFIQNAHDFKVYCYLCYMYNKDLGYVNVSLEKISKDTGMNRKTVQRAIKRLIDNNMVVKFKTNNDCNKYYLRYIEYDDSYEDEITMPTAKELFGDDCDKVIEMEYDVNKIFQDRKEIVFINKLEDKLNLKGIRQYRVFDGKYRIDYYIPELNIAIEYDENDHKYYSYEQHEGRQKEIENELGCRFIRVSDRYTDEDNIKYIMDKMY